MSEKKEEDGFKLTDEMERALYEKLAKKYGASTSSSVNVTIPDMSVELVYLSASLGHLETPSKNVVLDFTKFGQRFSLTRSQMDELIGTYSSWFDKGILAVSVKNADYAASKGVRTDATYAIDAGKLGSLGKMTPEAIEALWKDKSLTSEQRLAIVTFYKDKFIADETGYRDISRVSMLNKLTEGGFKAEVGQLSDPNFKYKEMDMSYGDKRDQFDPAKVMSQKIVDKDYRSDKD
jgi:hypothetical protein